MKKYATFFLVLVALAASVSVSAQAQPVRPETATVIDRGPIHRTLEYSSWQTNALGQVVSNRHRVKEVAGGMHYWADGAWKESRPVIVPHPDGAAALEGATKAVFGPDLIEARAVVFTGAGGQRLESRLVGVAYLDRQSGEMALVGRLKSCEGFIVGNNTVVYFDALDGLKADVQYVFSREGVEQNVVLREIIDPKALGMAPEQVEVQVINEFVNPPPVRVSWRVAKRERDPVLRAQMAFPDWHDCDIDLGSGLRFGHGAAFGWPASAARTWTTKRWEVVDQKSYLVESVGYPELAEALKGLPLLGAAKALPRLQVPVALVAGQRQYPALEVRMRVGNRQLAMASVEQRQAFEREGYLIDYTTVQSATNFTFEGETYFLSGTVTLGGQVVFEPAAVLKCLRTNWPNYVGITFSPDAEIEFRGKPYEPVFLTTEDDHTVGEKLIWATNTPAVSYGGLNLRDVTNNVNVQYLRVRYADEALRLNNNGATQQVNHCQFVHGNYGLFLYDYDATPIAANNLLFYNVTNVIYGNDYLVHGAHWTVNGCEYLADYDSPGELYLTNSLLSSIANYGSAFDSNHNSHVYLDANPFTNAVAGKHYLPPDSPYRDVCGTNLPASLLAELAKKTVSAPVVLSNTVYSSDTTLAPTVAVDTGLLDAGYHYDRADYLFYQVQVTNCTLSITGGVAVAAHGFGGVWLNGGNLTSQGTPVVPNTFTILAAVQEEPMLWGGTALDSLTFLNSYHTNGSDPQITLRDTVFHAFNLNVAYASSDVWKVNSLAARDSEFSRGVFQLYQEDMDFEFRNCLLENCALTGVTTNGTVWRNNLFKNGSILHLAWGGEPWVIKDNIFDATEVASVADSDTGYNAYVNVEYPFTPSNTNDVILTNLTYEIGPLGDYYLSTNQTDLIDKGSVTNAGQVGLYHQTTTTNQVREGSTRLDIGKHWLALDPDTGQPVDTDSDGVPDYLEDINGNGVLDASLGETDWETYTTLWSTNSVGLEVFTPLK